MPLDPATAGAQIAYDLIKKLLEQFQKPKPDPSASLALISQLQQHLDQLRSENLRLQQQVLKLEREQWEYQKAKQEPKWVPSFGARWKYWPTTKKFDPAPYCICCEPPKVCANRGLHSEHKVQILLCPSRKRHDELALNQFMLRDDHDNKLTIQDALERLVAPST